MKRKNAQVVSDKTKKIVLERQKSRSVSGSYLTPQNCNFHHYISVGAGGVGYEWNIIALTPSEHRQLHDGFDIKCDNGRKYTNEEFKTLIRNHFRLNYFGWEEKKCRYMKNKEMEDYGIVRISGNKKTVTGSITIKETSDDGGSRG